MANKTYLQMINDVLVRLREAEVATNDTTAYSSLVGTFINDAKRYVEDAYDWTALETTKTVTTSNGVYNYTITGAGLRFRTKRVLSQESNWFLSIENPNVMEDYLRNNTQQSGAPDRFCYKGADSNGDGKVLLFPVPNGVYNIDFDLIVPQAELASDSTVITVPDVPVILRAYAMAIRERGEDGGISASEAFGIAQQTLADYIAIEQGHNGAGTTWDAV